MNENFDTIDIRLLEQLQMDASQSNQQRAAQLGISPATCLRRTRRLRALGVLEKEVAILDPEALARCTGAPQPLACVAEISLDRQSQEALQAFEARAVVEAGVQQCWRVSSGPDFVLIVQVADMQAYQFLAQRLFGEDANVRNVKTYFVTRRAKFSTRMPIAAVDAAASAIAVAD
ncbi:Lrp/AsnC family transcriptional regulator [Corticibacter populi]|uniref:Lrp/AsnC family transcriptional regulator n=1 Tax=Corticibacter populi TaxID=1550736 RepID=A0A3M6R128_9BURK|nr:Lrp/AsnC family transcriptional regulator [Corticibacter populi]RMX08599.1 Lrp/AsnC family transcriptional regulator [Corticibacter populi]RZS35925.1 DNA-binding Lrp family transcriptional regulator [Corticibacter populi]